MPELPEVETIRRQILAKTKGKKIARIEIIDYKNANPKIKKLGLSRVKDVRRRAKLLIIDLANGYSFLVHLKLTGYFYYEPKGKKMQDKFTHVVFRFNGEALLFEDVRKFGWIKIMKTSEVKKYIEKEFNFGPEPLSKEFSLNKFKEMLAKKPKAKIKPLLLDQKFLAGLGNIYAQEACYYAGVKPTRKVGSLKENEIKKLHQGIQKILTAAIKHKGTSADVYVTLSGSKGEYEPLLKVYGKEKDPKGHSLKALKLGGRTTKYCPQCQK